MSDIYAYVVDWEALTGVALESFDKGSYWTDAGYASVNCPEFEREVDWREENGRNYEVAGTVSALASHLSDPQRTTWQLLSQLMGGSEELCDLPHNPFTEVVLVMNPKNVKSLSCGLSNLHDSELESVFERELGNKITWGFDTFKQISSYVNQWRALVKAAAARNCGVIVVIV